MELKVHIDLRKTVQAYQPGTAAVLNWTVTASGDFTDLGTALANAANTRHMDQMVYVGKNSMGSTICVMFDGDDIHMGPTVFTGNY